MAYDDDDPFDDPTTVDPDEELDDDEPLGEDHRGDLPGYDLDEQDAIEKLEHEGDDK
jgi:hypothetical protein